jgi:hypothetical protein
MSAVYTGTKRVITVRGVQVEARRAQWYLRTFHWAGDFYAWKMGWDFFIDGKFFDGGHETALGSSTHQPHYKTIAEFKAWEDPDLASDWEMKIKEMNRRAARASEEK